MAQPPQVIVVGGGLAGVSAAHSALQNGARVLLIDKKLILGGNSVKATSGINGGGTRVQKQKNIPDSAAIFEEDTVRSATGIKTGPAPTPYPLARVLTHKSAAGVEWLIDSFGLDLDTVSRLGGHSQPRTHRKGAGGKFPGMMITMGLMEKYDDLVKAQPHRARLIVKAPVKKLLTNAAGAVIGVQYEKDGVLKKEYGAVVVCSGGYGAGMLSADSLLHKIRPDLVHLPTTNGDHCTGDGIEFCTAVGASCVDLRHVQVHPTGLVNFSAPDEKIKFLAAEALRGEGAILLDKNGKRFCNDIGTRDYVTMSMWANEGPFFLVLNSKASSKILWHCKHYTGRGVMKHYNNIHDFAKEFKVDVKNIEATFAEYNSHAKSGTADRFGLKFFDAAPLDINDKFYIAQVTPVVHYTMGGVQIDENAAVVSAKTKKPIPGLFCAGEATGGVHGRNRLGGSALLECVVFGRVSGESAAKYIQANPKGFGPEAEVDNPSLAVSVKDLAAQDSQPNMEISTIPPDSHWKGKKTATAAPAEEEKAGSAASGQGRKPGKYTLEEVAKHKTETDCWVVVNGKVLDVTNFMKDHPGGKMAIMTFAGRDASEEFNMLHEANVVEKYAPDTIVGDLVPSSKL